MKHHATLLLGRLGWYESHIDPNDLLTNGLRISCVILLPLRVRPSATEQSSKLQRNRQNPK